MDFDEASKILSDATREELRDHAFGDKEVFWVNGNEKVGGGYFGGNSASVWVGEGEGAGSFKGEEARKLAELGTLGHVERNDETGPDEFTEGEVMPGLSLGDVYHELTGEFLDGS